MVSTDEVMTALQAVIDPELEVDIVNLGLIYQVEVWPATGVVLVEMTLTTPGCPLSQSMSAAVERAVLSLAGVKSVTVNLVWRPAWDPSMMTPVGRSKLGQP
jgi:metal-sulfur cluster biosynthetic enzyme